MVHVTCENLLLRLDDPSDTTVCWISARAFPFSLSGYFFVQIHAVGLNASSRFEDNCYGTAGEVALGFRDIIHQYKLRDTICRYTLDVSWPLS
ncbi:hypothetical protein PoB_003474500 [Plakobranchus ocellatus]|uniref:Uncharacterized protein n=1 Tax=Plakobranchus ocellatus TaxID=259542 RepID=A0AAV4ALJ7_9GAST|nr:hypothetical protein PoB_003474500 [Plakobranchus ocellatus]